MLSSVLTWTLRPTCPSCRRGTGRCRRWWRCWSGRCRHSRGWTCAAICTRHHPANTLPVEAGAHEAPDAGHQVSARWNKAVVEEINDLIQTKNPRKLVTAPAAYRNNMLWEQSRGDSWSWWEMYWMFWSEEATDPWLADWTLDIRWSSHHITARDWRHHHYQMRPGGAQVTTETFTLFHPIPDSDDHW